MMYPELLSFTYFQKCYVKIICNRLEDEKIIGFHLYSPNAGEITQGFAAAMMYYFSLNFVNFAHW
jgi:pyruvate/2-oxoglutarate dehydrogenase complex dihydrolipoamide dehydrogenase (E3) component